MDMVANSAGAEDSLSASAHTVAGLPRHVQQDYEPAVVLPSLSVTGILGIDLTTRDVEIIQFIISDLENEHMPFHSVWARMGFSDQSALYLTIATSLLSWSRRRATAKDAEAEASIYYAKGLRKLSSRLGSSNDCASVGVIVSIVGCVCHDVSTTSSIWSLHTLNVPIDPRGTLDSWSTHFDGLHRVVQLRGGTYGLDQHMLTIIFWLELVGSTVLDSVPRFPVPHHIAAYANVLEYKAPRCLQSLLLDVLSTFNQLSPICRAMYMLSSVARNINQHSGDAGFWNDAISAVNMLGPVTHYLLSMPRQDWTPGTTSPELAVAELTRLVCLLILSRLKGKFLLNTVDSHGLASAFMARLHELPSIKTSRCLEDLKLWSLITFALLHHGGHDEALIPDIRAAIGSDDIFRATHAMDLVRGLLWVDVLIDAGRVERLMYDIEFHQSPSPASREDSHLGAPV
ncbi:Hypothetical protein D9617_3g019820 [Elsinoe fawcettii]|nr:Hypothetical protein D9617_3g019820 [Elsinoe fawcettii]